MNIEKIKANFKQKLSVSGWDRILESFINSSEFDTLITNLIKIKEERNITPDSTEMFKAFYECPYKDLSVVMVGQDPYPKIGIADGIAFSCSHSTDGTVQPSLKAIFQEVQKTVYAATGEDWYSWNPDLTRWSNQGILMLNTALTTEPGKIGVHYDLWKPFIKYLFNKLIENNTGLIYVFMGNAAKEWSKIIPESNYKLFCYHPASACYSGGEWDSNDIFNRINQLLEENNNKKIIW